ncbi:MAG: methionyl-tRNA formyltransferase [Euryarchaeota archaeon]|nr:methionyl-tRNA formyltransferase [Euryarchaeota archaeon]
MSSERLNIVFMGTPEFASTCLEAILDSDHNVVGVVTAPDRQSGRGRKVSESAVKKTALKHALPLAQPEKLKAPEFHDILKLWGADLFVVVAFRMLPEVVWDMPSLGTYNLHASLLPQFRGAAPIQRAIMQGAKESGATVFKLAHKIDTGNIISRVNLDIGPHENAGSLHDRILSSGSVLLVETLDKIAEGTHEEIPQCDLIESDLLEAPKIFKEDRAINWNSTSIEIHNHVRGLSPYPAAFTSSYKILEGYPSDKKGLNPGQVCTLDGKIIVGTTDGSYEITRLQPAGKSAMDSSAFIRGLRGEMESFA